MYTSTYLLGRTFAASGIKVRFSREEAEDRVQQLGGKEKESKMLLLFRERASEIQISRRARLNLNRRESEDLRPAHRPHVAGPSPATFRRIGPHFSSSFPDIRARDATLVS